MANNLIAGPNVAIAKQTIGFVAAGVTSVNTAKIYRIGISSPSYVPGRPVNQIEGFEEGKGYYIVMKQAVDWSGFLAPPIDGVVLDGVFANQFSTQFS